MADRIFPSRVSEDRLDSELVFKGIDWDNFQVKTAKKEKMPAELLEHFKSLNGDAEGTKDKKDDSKDKEAKASSEKDHVLAALLALAAEDEDSEEEFVSESIRNKPSNNTDHSPASIHFLRLLGIRFDTITIKVFFGHIHCRFFGKHIHLPELIFGYSH